MMDVYGTIPLRATDILNSVKDRPTSVQLIVVNVCVLFVYLFVLLFFVFILLFCFCFVVLFYTIYHIFTFVYILFLVFFFKLCFIFLFQSDTVLVWFGGVVKAIFCALGALFVVKKNQAFKSLQSHHLIRIITDIREHLRNKILYYFLIF